MAFTHEAMIRAAQAPLLRAPRGLFYSQPLRLTVRSASIWHRRGGAPPQNAARAGGSPARRPPLRRTDEEGEERDPSRDGMGMSTITAARIFDGQRHGKLGEENELAFESFPYVALAKTYSVNAQVSESAATMTAMMTGVKTNADVIGLDERSVQGDFASA
jgi:hypothetical protein